MKKFNTIFSTFAIVFAVLMLSRPAMAEDFHKNGIQIIMPWARATAKSAAVGAAYLQVHNQGSASDVLLSASSTVCKKVQLHSMVIEKGVMKMREIKGGVVIPAGGKAEFKPGGNHIMLTGLIAPLKQGETIPIVLHFQKAGDIEVKFLVGAIGSVKPPVATKAA